MADDSMSLLETLRKASADGDVDFLREGVRLLAQAIMEAEVSELTGRRQGRARPGAPPDPPQRVPRAALGHPGGHHRPRRPAGPRRLVPAQPARAAPAGRAGPARGRPGGVRVGRLTRRVDDLVRALGIEGISRSEVSPASAPPSTPRSRRSAARSLADIACPYLWLDATYLKVREGGRVVSMAALVATGVAADRRAPGARARAQPGQRRGQRLAALHPLARRARPPRRAPRHQRRPRGAREGDPTSSSWARPGSAAASTSPATPRTSCPARPGAWSPRPIRMVFEQPDGLAPGSSSTG